MDAKNSLLCSAAPIQYIGDHVTLPIGCCCLQYSLHYHYVLLSAEADIHFTVHTESRSLSCHKLQMKMLISIVNHSLPVTIIIM